MERFLVQWSVLERSDRFLWKNIVICSVWFFSLLLILNTESWSQEFEFLFNKYANIMWMTSLLSTSCAWKCALLLEGSRNFSQCVGFCGLGFRPESGGQSGFWKVFCLFSKPVLGVLALMDVSLKTLSQNYDKFMFCRWWKSEMRDNYKTPRTAEEKKILCCWYCYKLIWFHKVQFKCEKQKNVNIFICSTSQFCAGFQPLFWKQQ